MSRSTPARRPSRRPAVVLLWLLGGALVTSGAALTASAALQALDVRSDLSAVVPEVDALRAGLGGDASDAFDPESLDRVGATLERAVARTDRFDWWFAERIPVVGANFEAVRTAAETAEVVARDVLEPTLALPIDGLAVDGRLDAMRLGELARTSARGLESLEQQLGRLDRLDRSALLPEVSQALAMIEGPLQEASSLATSLAPMIRALPDILGEDAPRDIVVLFQNSAESRALGGIAGASVLIHIEDGALAVTRTLSAADFTAHAEPLLPLPADADALYRSDGYPLTGTAIHEVTSRPDFSYGARVAALLWEESQGVEPDLVRAVDPLALSYLMRATGPVMLDDGSQLSADTVVGQLLNGVYRAYGALTVEANRAQDAYFTSVVQAIVAEVQDGTIDLRQAVGAWAQAVDERRLLAWSADRVEQRAILRADVGGVLPETTPTHVPFGLYLADAVGSKLEYYLQQEVRLAAGACDADGSRSVTLASSFTNTIDTETAVDAEEFDYITGMYEREGLERGEIRLRIMLYAPEQAQIGAVRIDGTDVPYTAGSDSGRPVAYTMVTVPLGATVQLEVDTVVHHAAGERVSFEGTPGVRPTTVDNAVEPCS